MGRNFLPDTVSQTLRFSPSLHDWLPEGHLARFPVDVVAALQAEAREDPEREHAGTGYFSAANVTSESVKDIDPYIAAERNKHGGAVETGGARPPPQAAAPEEMRHRLRTETGSKQLQSLLLAATQSGPRASARSNSPKRIRYPRQTPGRIAV